jgi:hypothetical protein
MRAGRSRCVGEQGPCRAALGVGRGQPDLEMYV